MKEDEQGTASPGSSSSTEVELRRELDAVERRFGPGHPLFVEQLNKLAMVLCEAGRLTEAEPLVRRVLQIVVRNLGWNHPSAIVAADDYVTTMAMMGLEGEAIAEKLRAVAPELTLTAAGVLVDRHTAACWEMRTEATQHYCKGDYSRANELLERLLRRGYDVPGTCTHLARVALVADRREDCRAYVDRAWVARGKAAPYVVLRILWLQLALLMSGAPPGTAASAQQPAIRALLGKIKTALLPDGAVVEWTMQPVLDHLRSEVGPDDFALLSALVAALSHRSQSSAPEAFPAWREVAPVPLD
jgi:hypothetical protein